MQNRNRTLLFALASGLTLSVAPLRAQSQAPEETASVVQYMNRAMRFQQAFPQEKVYVHFDNTGYFQGERIWMKVYVTRADNGQPTDLSQVVYVELLSQSGDVVERRKLKVEHGEAVGDILLDKVIGTGFFEVRAYTRYMLNFGAETAFSRVLPIFRRPAVEGNFENPVIDTRSARYRMPEREVQTDTVAALDPAAHKRRKGGGYHVNFYPEGGNLVVGLPSRVAFTVSDRDYKPVAMSGLLQDSRGETITVVRTDSDGRGIFEVVPSDTLLSLALSGDGKRKGEFQMDGIETEGCVVRADAVTDDSNVLVQLWSSAGMQGRLLGYTVMNNGNILHADTAQAAPELVVSLRRDQLRPGVNQFTCFDSSGRILAERLFFLCPPVGGDTVGVQPVTTQLTPCGKVELDVQTRPHARLSLSAMDATTLPNAPYGSIRTYMLLGSEVSGYIPHPERFFEADDEAHRLAADSLMLFNGWRRYRWEQMSALRPWPDRIQPIEDGLNLFGNLYRARNRWRSSNALGGVDLTAILYNTKGDHYQGTARTDSSGYYAFRLPDLEGDYALKIETRLDGDRKSYTVGIDRRFAPAARYLDRTETQRLPLTPSRRLLGLTAPQADDAAADEEEEEREKNEPLRQRVGKHDFVTKTVKVKAKKHYWTDYTGGWYNEADGQYHADLYYNCVDATEELTDRGEDVPTFLSWLCVKNPLLRPDGTVFTQPMTDKDYAARISTSLRGLRYDNRPIIWIVDNCYDTISGFTHEELQRQLNGTGIMPIHKNGHPIPVFLDDVKSVYISVDDPTAADQYVMGLDGLRAAVAFVYTIPTVSTESRKGRRNTFFQGFNRPEKFQPEDYSQLAPQPDDVRRTLHWEPTLEADGEGRAHVVFYNNYSCRSILLSVEGLAPDGTPLSNE